MIKEFKELSIRKETLDAIYKMGFEMPTKVQATAIEPFLEGKNVIVQSHTGTGKTAAFGIPLNELVTTKHEVQAIVLCPTRELAVQVSNEMKLISANKNIRITPIYGGQSIDVQFKALKRGTQIVVGTPGRVMDHMRRKTLKLDAVKYVVLDEADNMMDMGFIDDIKFILSSVPDSERQTALFSATMPGEIVKLAKTFINDPVMVDLVDKKRTVSATDQYYLEVSDIYKTEVLGRLLEYYKPELSMVFCNTKKKVDELSQELSDKGFAVEGLHGDMSQHLRTRVMNSVRSSSVKVLVATDVAARGIDVENVEAVFNYDVPMDQEYYVHRIGRTGRAGKSGLAFTFTYGRSYRRLRDIQRYIKTDIEKMEIPSAKRVNKKRMDEFYDAIEGVLKEGNLSEFVDPVEKLIKKDYSSIEIAAALIKMNLPKPLKEKEFEMVTSHKSKNISSEAVRLFINVGKSHGIKVSDIVGAIVNECGISGKDVGQITLLSRFSYVDVERSQAEKVIRKMNESNIKGNSINVEIAKPRKNEHTKKDFHSKNKSYDRDGSRTKSYERDGSRNKSYDRDSSRSGNKRKRKR